MATVSSDSAMERSLNSVFIGNIAYDATEEGLKDLFSQVGPVVGVRLVFDRETGKSKGYGFCEFADKETALSAQRNLNGVDFLGRQLRVDAAVGDRSKEEMQQLRMAFASKDEENPSNREQDPEKVPQEIARMVMQLPPEQMFELMKQMKRCLETSRAEAKNMLMKNPHLTFALLQVLLCTKQINFSEALSLLVTQPVVDAPQPASSVAPQKVPLLSLTPQLAPVSSADMYRPPAAQILRPTGMPAVASTGLAPSDAVRPPSSAQNLAKLNVDPEKSALIRQVMSLTDEQVAALPLEHKQTIMALRQQFRNMI